MTVSSDTRDPRGRGTVRRVAIPEVVGLNLENARIVLSNAGFVRTKVHYTEDYAPQFEVVGQFPRPGLLVNPQGEVELRVSRQSLVHFLPSVFQQTALDGASWLKGFLYIIQNVHDSVNTRLARMHELFDPRTTDDDFLPWLGSWLAITLNPDWNELQRRKMFMAATRLFASRGTAHAIKEFVRIYVDANVEIEENSWPFQGFRIGVHSTVGDDTVILPPMNLAHCFVVRLDKPASQTPDTEIIKIHQIIQIQKPAHTSYFLAFSDEAATGLMGAFMAIGVEAAEGEAAVGFGIGIGFDGAPVARDVGDKEPSSGLLYQPEPEPDPASEAGQDKKVPLAKQPKTAAKKPLTSAKKTSTPTKKGATSTDSSAARRSRKGGEASGDASTSVKATASPKSASSSSKRAASSKAAPSSKAAASSKSSSKRGTSGKAGAAKADRSSKATSKARTRTSKKSSKSTKSKKTSKE